MNRTDRLHALSKELRRAGTRGRTAARLAGWLEVSTRTIKRDVAALQQAGLPVWAQAGPGGGYVLDEAATLPPVNLTRRRRSRSRWRSPRTRTRRTRPTDEPPWRRSSTSCTPPPGSGPSSSPAGSGFGRQPQHGRAVLTAVEDGLAQRRVLVLRYQDRLGASSRRRVEPHLLARTDDYWYLVGWCHTRRAVRWFRWDRIAGADLTTEPVPDRDPALFGTPPPDAHPVR